MNIGNGAGSSALNGHVKQITYWPKAMTNSDLQIVSSAAGRYSLMRPILNRVI
jgi:hypothetical protein